MSDYIFRLSHLRNSIISQFIHNFFLVLIFIAISIGLFSCSSVKFTGEEKKEESARTPDKEIETTIPTVNLPATITPVRVLINDKRSEIDFMADNILSIRDNEKNIAVVKKGNKINLTISGESVILKVNESTFRSDIFIFSSGSESKKFNFDGKNYRGAVIISAGGKVINTLGLEEYLKGVLPAEMPLGKENENYEALKAFAICARTYTIMKLKEHKKEFDLFMDVRDQVYGGTDREKELSDKAVDATTGLILKYQNEPAVMFYSASCGGFSEEGGNVFTSANDKPYLSIVKDGDEPYCIITPKFQWEEVYTKEQYLSRFIKAGLIPEGYSRINSLEITSRFNSGRVNELELQTSSASGEKKSVKIYGNQIRSIIRTADNKGILRSTMFDVTVSGDNVIIKGKGYGHGVGLCQWGAIGQSRQGKSFTEILSHYFPGTTIANF